MSAMGQRACNCSAIDYNKTKPLEGVGVCGKADFSFRGYS